MTSPQLATIKLFTKTLFLQLKMGPVPAIIKIISSTIMTSLAGMSVRLKTMDLVMMMNLTVSCSMMKTSTETGIKLRPLLKTIITR